MREQVGAFVAQMLGQLPIGWILIGFGQQAVQFGFQPAGGRPQSVQRDLLLQNSDPVS